MLDNSQLSFRILSSGEYALSRVIQGQVLFCGIYPSLSKINSIFGTDFKE